MFSILTKKYNSACVICLLTWNENKQLLHCHRIITFSFSFQKIKKGINTLLGKQECNKLIGADKIPKRNYDYIKNNDAIHDAETVEVIQARHTFSYRVQQKRAVLKN